MVLRLHIIVSHVLINVVFVGRKRRRCSFRRRKFVVQQSSVVLAVHHFRSMTDLSTNLYMLYGRYFDYPQYVTSTRDLRLLDDIELQATTSPSNCAFNKHKHCRTLHAHCLAGNFAPTSPSRVQRTASQMKVVHWRNITNLGQLLCAQSMHTTCDIRHMAAAVHFDHPSVTVAL